MNYYKQIDGLRFVAIFFVFMQHFAYFIGKKISAGYYGVDLFFVISGYLITYILITREEPFGVSYKKFIGRRTLRIFPIYYLSILILFFVGLEPVREYLGYFLTYTFNYAYAYYDIPDQAIGHYWSLCVEEQFYLIWPVLILGLKANKKILYVLCTFIVVLSFAQISFNIFKPVTRYNYVGVFPRAGSLCLGALGAMLHRDNLLNEKLLKNRWFEYLMFAVLIFAFAIESKFRPLLFSLSSLYLILKSATTGFNSRIVSFILSHKTIVYFGTISYGIYVYHMPLGYYFDKFVFTPEFWAQFNFKKLGPLAIIQYNVWLIKFVIYGILSILLAHLSFKFIEKPILSYKDRLFRYQAHNPEGSDLDSKPAIHQPARVG